MNTIRFLFGSSGVGKSTRMYQLFKFLKSIEKPHILLIRDVPMGFEFKELGVAIIGKENMKPGGVVTFQGLDAFIGKLGNFEQQYNAIYEYCESSVKDIIVESVLAMSTNRTGPQYILDNKFNVKYNSEFFVYPSFDDFRQRVADRGGKFYEKEEDAKIWLKNKAYIRKYDVFQEEIKDMSRFNLNKFSFDDHMNNFGKRFLQSSGREHMVEDYIDFVRIDAGKPKQKAASLFGGKK